jgi:Cu+-exporting ATPase
MLLVLVTLGRVIEGHQRYKSLHQVNEFLHRESQVVEVMRDNELTETTVNEILAGDVFTVKVNERNPVLARVEDGESHFSTEWRNGEFVQEAHQKGSMVQPGDLNIHAPVRLVALQAGNDDNDWLRYSNSLKKAFAETTPIEQTAHQLARVLLITIIPLAIITSAIVGWQAQSIGPAIERLLSILLVACPCALGIATPLVLRLGLNRALSSGFCFRSASIFEPLAKCRRLAFDITGTLTTRTLGIQSANIHDDNFHSANVYRLLNMMINSSSHPKAEALMRWTKEQEEQGFNNNNHKPDDNISKIEYKPGKGVVAYLDSGKRAVLGNSALAKDVFPAINHLYQDTTCYCYDGKVLASFTFAYSWRESLEKILEELKTKTNLTLAAISGGSVLPESSNTESPLFHETFLEQTPEAKQQLVASWEKNSQPTAMIGDGANDLPALMKASVSMAFDDPDAATTESVDITLHPSAFSHLPALFSLARRVKHIIRFNLAWVLLYNSLAVTAAVFGWLHPVIATLIMILSSVTVLAVSCLVTAPPPFRQSQKSTEEILNQLRTVQGKPSAVAGPA